jgi:cytochrome c-type biogenesis protein CcmH/NrfG
MYLVAGFPTKAEEMFNNALALEPSHPNILVAYARLLISQVR